MGKYPMENKVAKHENLTDGFPVVYSINYYFSKVNFEHWLNESGKNKIGRLAL